MNGKDLMTGMSFVDEKYIQEAEIKQLKKPKPFFLNKYVGIAACFVLLVSTAIGIASSLRNPAPPVIEPPGPIEKFPDESANFLLDMGSVHSNTISGIGENDVWYDPEVYDVRNWNTTDISEYYGKELQPPYLPEELMASRHNNSTEAIYTKDGAIVSDLVTLGFYTDYYEDGSPKLFEETGYVKGISIQAVKIGELTPCMYVEPETERQTTDISGTNVTLGILPASEDSPEVYTAEFQTDGIQYKVTGWQMRQEEVLKVVASIIRGDANISILN